MSQGHPRITVRLFPAQKAWVENHGGSDYIQRLIMQEMEAAALEALQPPCQQPFEGVTL